MFSAYSRTIAKTGVRNFKVAVLGASGGIGQPLALLLKLDRNVTELALFDVVKTPGVAADISHCCTPAKVFFCEWMISAPYLSTAQLPPMPYHIVDSIVRGISATIICISLRLSNA